MNSKWKRVAAMAMVLSLICACTSMRETSRYWSDTIADGQAAQARDIGGPTMSADKPR
jgi:hypothetical protein